ncbi:MAG TPA: hypothetical protein VFG31_06270 [Conexibacter sp.]|nr:hypothetical protein [Conexibacter sp.]
MRRAALALVLVAAAGTAALALVGASERRTLAFTLGVSPTAVAMTLAPGQEACQQPLLVEASFDVVELRLAAGGAPSPPLAVDVRAPEGGAPIAHGTLMAQDAPASVAAAATGMPARVSVGHVGDGRTVAICVRNRGAAPVGLFGGPDVAARGSGGQLDGQPTGTDLALVLRTTHPRSTIALLPDVLARAALFRAGWIGAWLYWALLAAVLVVVPALLVVALRAASEAEPRER